MLNTFYGHIFIIWIKNKTSVGPFHKYFLTIWTHITSEDFNFITIGFSDFHQHIWFFLRCFCYRVYPCTRIWVTCNSTCKLNIANLFFRECSKKCFISCYCIISTFLNATSKTSSYRLSSCFRIHSSFGHYLHLTL